MNIQEALQVPVSLVLQKMNAQLFKENEKEAWYFSPFRLEKTASFHVELQKNVWYDFGEAEGGDVLNLVCLHLKKSKEDHTVVDALRWLANMTQHQPFKVPELSRNKIKPHSKLELKHSTKLGNVSLIKYLQSRGVNVKTASTFVKEVLIYNSATNTRFFAIGFRNEDRGWELRNPFFKGCIAPKTISFIRAEKPKPDSIHLFEGFMDFLTIASQDENLCKESDTIVLNSINCLSQALPYIKDYGYRTLYSWMDNDSAGTKATHTLREFVKTQEALTHIPMNHHYFGFKDVNEWHVQTRGLIPVKL